MEHSESAFLLKISMDFTAKAVQRCSKACVASVKTATPTDMEKACLENCVAKHTKLFGEGLQIISRLGNAPSA